LRSVAWHICVLDEKINGPIKSKHLKINTCFNIVHCKQKDNLPKLFRSF
jgi:hypothetical protein